jgi:ParB family transcriptional regulator, chromosome partitioning protein
MTDFVNELLDAVKDIDRQDQERTGRPLELPLDRVDEDPDQPRCGFDPTALAELAASIKTRGVKVPISVRRAGERFIVNHGARRLRAARLAGLERIPAFLDEAHELVDQVVENAQREDLSILEIAEAVRRLAGTGMKKGEIARQLGKPAAFVSLHLAIALGPEEVRAAIRTGRIEAPRAAYELIQLMREAPNTARGVLDGTGPITVARIAQATAQTSAAGQQQFLAAGDNNEGMSENVPKPVNRSIPQERDGTSVPRTQSHVTPASLSAIVDVGGREHELVLTGSEPKAGLVRVMDGDGKIRALSVQAVRLVRVQARKG